MLTIQELGRTLRSLTLADKLVLAGAAVATILFFLGHQHLGGALKPVPAQDCSQVLGGKTITIEITDREFKPAELSATLCDTLVFINHGVRPHQPAVGPHPYHTLFPGFDSKIPLKPGEQFSIQMNRLGTFPFHDHDYPDITGKVTVNVPALQ